MNKLLLALLFASGLALGCGSDEDTTGGSGPLKPTPANTDACAAVRCAYGPCVVKDGKPVCTDTRPDTGTDAGTGDCRSSGCDRAHSCEPCKTTTGAAYVCLSKGAVC